MEKTEILESVHIGIQDNWRENSQKKSLEIDTLAVPFICTPLVGQDIETTRDEFTHLAGLQLADDAKADTRSEVDILIGCDASAKFFTGEIQIPANQRGPTAMNTLLGWVISGQGVRKRTRLPDSEETNTYLLKVDCKCAEIEIRSQLEKSWDFESVKKPVEPGQVHYLPGQIVTRKDALKRLKKRTLFLRNFKNYFETRRFMNSCRNVRLLGDLF